MNVDLNGRIALVTGAAQGIGKAIADVLAVNGARVIYADIDLKTAQQSASRFPGCYAVSMNVADETQVNAGVSDIASQHSRIDILVNNAGINTLKHRVTIDEFPREEWDKILAVDLTGLYLVSKAVSRQMLLQERPGGRIINIASVGGLVPLRLQCAFIAAKAGADVVVLDNFAPDQLRADAKAFKESYPHVKGEITIETIVDFCHKSGSVDTWIRLC